MIRTPRQVKCFVNKTTAFPSGAPFGCAKPTRKYKTKPKMIAKGKIRSSLIVSS
jgi:hypothetical protein